MEKFIPLLLDVWRESCCNFGIADSLERIVPMLARRIPVRMMIVRRLDMRDKTLETAAVGVNDGQNHESENRQSVPAKVRSEFAPDDFERLLEWFGRIDQVAGEDASHLHETIPGLLPDGLEGPVIVTLLSGESDPIGVLILAAHRPRSFRPEHNAMAAALREPFAVALENDQRLRELTQLREAAEAENRSLLSRLGRENICDAIIGEETGLRNVMQRVELVAPSNAPVLILGETGSGKEVVARAVHARSARSTGPFLRVNCGAIPPELIDS
ncbi:MAG: sigma 54-interacting transcriptional regulator, partial [Planctomycetota bacterium]|nr:sigma 54-interacting transcriptional regulator [Planctomycetota bacterium]